MSRDGSQKQKQKRKGRNTRQTYTAAPTVPAELQKRYQLVMAVLSGELTVSEAARRMGVARNHFQTLMHRAVGGLIEGLSPRPTGRPPKPAREAELEEQLERERRETEALRFEVQTAERLMGAVGDLLRKQRLKATASTSRQGRRRTRPAATKAAGNEGDDEGEAPRADVEARCRDAEERLAKAAQLVSEQVTRTLAAAAVGISVATLGRWRTRQRRGEPLRRKRGPSSGHAASAEVRAKLAVLVRCSHGLMGADSLRRSVLGASRREAARVKAQLLTELERERRAACSRMVVTQAGVVRGFDAMHVVTTRGPHFVLAAGDASVPYRTSCMSVERYDARSVLQALAEDMERHGAPLVYRMDRAKCHQTPEVVSLLASRGVLVLHGPARYPRFYGQLERQNREHRAWLRALGVLSPLALEDECEKMREFLNQVMKRRSLDWRTSAELWSARPPLGEDRLALRDDVNDRAARLRRRLEPAAVSRGLAERLAIEQALTARGYLRRIPGGWC